MQAPHFLKFFDKDNNERDTRHNEQDEIEAKSKFDKPQARGKASGNANLKPNFAEVTQTRTPYVDLRNVVEHRPTTGLFPTVLEKEYAIPGAVRDNEFFHESELRTGRGNYFFQFSFTSILNRFVILFFILYRALVFDFFK